MAFKGLKLGVNIDHVATVREARGAREPDPVWAARVCERSGAHSVVMHLREDRRHIQDADLFRVKQAVSLKVNLEMSLDPSVVRTALRLRPDQVTFVPERRMERTTEGGLDLFKKTERLRDCVRSFQAKGVSVSLFIDPEIREVEEARRIGADAVELHTGDYARQRSARGAAIQLGRLRRAAEASLSLGLGLYAGHGLDYRNAAGLKTVPGIEELNIGFAIVTRALEVGLANAVKQMLRLIGR